MNDHDRPESEAADGIAFELRRGDLLDATRLYKWEKMVGPPLAVPVALLGIFSLLAVVPDPVFGPPSKVFAFLVSWPVVAIVLAGVATLNIVFWREPWRIVDQVFEGTGEPVEVASRRTRTDSGTRVSSWRATWGGRRFSIPARAQTCSWWSSTRAGASAARPRPTRSARTRSTRRTSTSSVTGWMATTGSGGSRPRRGTRTAIPHLRSPRGLARTNARAGDPRSPGELKDPLCRPRGGQTPLPSRQKRFTRSLSFRFAGNV